MNVRILGAATGPAELERDGLHAINGCFVPSVTYFSYWLACLSDRRLKLSEYDDQCVRHRWCERMLYSSYNYHTNVSHSRRKLSTSIIDRDIDSYRFCLSRNINNMQSVHNMGSAPVDQAHLIP